MKNWNMLLFICAFMLVFALVFQSIPPVMGFLIPALNITHAQAGLLMSLFGFPGIFLSLPIGIATDVYGSRKVGLWALAVAAAGSLVVALGPNFSLLLFGRIIAGVGALTIAIVAPQALSRRFAPEDMGKVMGIFHSVMPLGTILTLNTFGRLADAFSWRLPLFAVFGYTVLLLILFYFKYSAAAGEGAESMPDLKENKAALREIKGGVWLTAGMWLAYNAAAISYLSFGADYFASVGYEPAYAGFLTSLLMIGALFLSPVVGYLTDKFGGEVTFIAVGGTALAVLFWLVPRVGINPLFLGILIGVFAPFIPAPVFSLLPGFLPPERLGLGYGILSSLLNLGVLIGPFLVGLFYDLRASYVPGFNLMAFFALLTAVFALLLKTTGKQNARASN